MLAKVLSATTVGLEGVVIEVEVDVAQRGFPTLTIVGLPNKSVDEAKDRVRTAIVNAGYEMPDSRITVNLAPADIPKIGSCFDLPIAIGILAASGVIKSNQLANSLFVGELSLEGNVRKVPGVIALALLAKQEKIPQVFVPSENSRESNIVENVMVYPVESLSQLIMHFTDKKEIKIQKKEQNFLQEIKTYEHDFADIKGQEQAKRVLEIAAAGFHNIHMRGSPGAGKTLLSRAFASIIPPLENREMLEVSKIYSITGLLQDQQDIYSRPFRSPHHTISRMGLIGGGSHPMPGEISLAHRGVLFLDEFTEFPSATLEAMRQPLEDGVVTISRAAGRVTFPCRFLLVAASNPCPCGYLSHPKKKCVCHQTSVINYSKKLSGPLLDRIDLHIDVPPVDEEKLMQYTKGETSAKVKERVLAALEIQHKRFTGTSLCFNSEMSPKDMKKYCILTSDAEILLKQAVIRLALSGRSYARVIKIARTIADLACSDDITNGHIAEALQYRLKT